MSRTGADGNKEDLEMDEDKELDEQWFLNLVKVERKRFHGDVKKLSELPHSGQQYTDESDDMEPDAIRQRIERDYNSQLTIGK